MNTETGEILRGLQIQEARNRGESIVEISEEVARMAESERLLVSQLNAGPRRAERLERMRLSQLVGR